MSDNSIPFPLPGLVIKQTIATAGNLVVYAEATRKEACCPDCRQPSSRHHSRYIRRVQDTPIGSQAVELHIRSRRFRCVSPDCPRRTFVEQHSEVVPRRGRRTDRLTANLTHIGLTAGGQAGARLAMRLQMPTSGDTLLRLLRRIDLPPTEIPTVIGIDDWAFCKGKKYGTIIVDLERRCPIDLLPSRHFDAVQQWLQEQSSVAIVARDRSGEYREAATSGAPQALQVADRWHLVQNLRQAVERYLTRRYSSLNRLPSPEIAFAPSSSSLGQRRRYANNPEREELHNLREIQRQERFMAVKARHQQGAYTTEIAREFQLSRKTVSLWTNSEALPPDSRGRFKRICLIDKYELYLRKRLAEGCTNKSQLWREICQQGFSGSRTLVGKWIRQYQKRSDTSEPRKRTRSLSPKQLVWVLFRHDEQHTPDEELVWRRLQQDEELVAAREVVHEFLFMLRKRQNDHWEEWLKRCSNFPAKELRNFAHGLKRDEAAVEAALVEPWSNGQVEGHVNRLKFYKRQMYGRAKFDLLRIRVLSAF